MYIVDINTMLGPWAFQKLEFSEASELVQKMDHYSITTAYAYSSYAVRVSPLDGNYMLMDQLKGYEDRIRPCWVVVPTWDMESEKKLEPELKKNGVKMVRLKPNDHGYIIDAWVCGELYAMLEKNRIPLLFSGTDVTVSQLHAISAAYPELPIILTQCEYPQNRSIYKLLEQHPRIYLEISTYYIYYGIEDIVEKFGAKRLLFGSRMPFQEGGAALGMTLLAAISETDRNKILGGNLDALLSEVRL